VGNGLRTGRHSLQKFCRSHVLQCSFFTWQNQHTVTKVYPKCPITQQNFCLGTTGVDLWLRDPLALLRTIPVLEDHCWSPHVTNNWSTGPPKQSKKLGLFCFCVICIRIGYFLIWMFLYTSLVTSLYGCGSSHLEILSDQNASSYCHMQKQDFKNKVHGQTVTHLVSQYCSGVYTQFPSRPIWTVHQLESCAIAKMTAWCADKSKQPHRHLRSRDSVDSIQPDVRT